MCQIPPVDLRFTEDQERFRSEVRQWLEQNAPSPVFGRPALRSLDTAEGFEEHRAWEKRMFDARLTVVSWPVEYGGRGLGLWDWIVFEEEYYRARAPIRVGQNGIFLLAPTIFEFGTAEQKARFLPPMASGEEIWCQGWSEPDAGSDLAGIRSTARRAPADDGWILNGQKTWCSRGAFADWIFGLFRSDPDSERHRGLTYFLVKSSTPGVTVRPIPQIDRETGFAEIFFDDVRVPDGQVLGEPGSGWQVAMSTAGSERGMSLRSPARYTAAADRLVSLYTDSLHGDSQHGDSLDTDSRYTDSRYTDSRYTDSLNTDRYDEGHVSAGSLAEDVARAWTAAEAYRLHTYWTATRIAAGSAVGAEASVGKIHWSETDLAIQTTALELLGSSAYELGDAASGSGEWLDGFLFSLAGTIYAGTNEIQRNVVAERLLGLPR
jgi:alkylation response protein AidB-like acyl-CoA dehydrogenase